MEKVSKESILNLVECLVNEDVITGSDLKRYIPKEESLTSPEYVRLDLERWYINMGIEDITGKKFQLSECPFTKEEIEEAKENNEIIICIPKDVTREQFGELFRIDSWALHDNLVTSASEKSDFWMRTSANSNPSYVNMVGIDLINKLDDENKLHFSLERYLVFIQRMKYLKNITPDEEYWIWLPKGRYDRSGILVAGYDRNGNFNVHGWMPRFSASFVGARFGTAPNNLN